MQNTKKVVNFTHFNKKNTHINACKIVHIYKNAIVIVHIYTITVALHTNILLISHFTHFFSLLHLQNQRIFSPSSSSSSSDTYTPTNTKSKSTIDTTKSNTLTHRHTNRDRESGSALVADRCLWIGEFQPWWIGEWPWMERRVSNGEWRESLR